MQFFRVHLAVIMVLLLSTAGVVECQCDSLSEALCMMQQHNCQYCPTGYCTEISDTCGLPPTPPQPPPAFNAPAPSPTPSSPAVPENLPCVTWEKITSSENTPDPSGLVLSMTTCVAIEEASGNCETVGDVFPCFSPILQGWGYHAYDASAIPKDNCHTWHEGSVYLSNSMYLPQKGPKYENWKWQLTQTGAQVPENAIRFGSSVLVRAVSNFFNSSCCGKGITGWATASHDGKFGTGHFSTINTSPITSNSFEVAICEAATSNTTTEPATTAPPSTDSPTSLPPPTTPSPSNNGSGGMYFVDSTNCTNQSCSAFISAIVSGDYGYFGTNDEPGAVVKYNLDTMAEVGSVTGIEQEKTFECAVTDGTFGYFGVSAGPLQVVKFNLATMERVGAVKPSTSQDPCSAAAISGEFGYFATDKSIIKFNLTAMKQVGSVSYAFPAYTYFNVGAVGDDAGYFGISSREVGAATIAIVSLNNMTKMGTITVGTPTETQITVAAVHGNFGYFSTLTNVTKYNLETRKRVGAIEVRKSEGTFSVAAFSRGFGYFATTNLMIVKFDLSTMQRVGAAELPQDGQTLKFSSAVFQDGFGYFGTQGNWTKSPPSPASVAKFYLDDGTSTPITPMPPTQQPTNITNSTTTEPVTTTAAVTTSNTTTEPATTAPPSTDSTTTMPPTEQPTNGTNAAASTSEPATSMHATTDLIPSADSPTATGDTSFPTTSNNTIEPTTATPTTDTPTTTSYPTPTPPSPVPTSSNATGGMYFVGSANGSQIGTFPYSFETAVLDGSFGYYTYEGNVMKFNLEQMKLVEIWSDNMSQGGFTCGGVNGKFGYFGTNGIPGQVVRLNLDTLAKVNSGSGTIGQNLFSSAVINGSFIYFGTGTHPGQVVRFDLATTGLSGSASANQGEDTFNSAVALGGNAYFGTATSPGKVVQFNLDTMSRIDAVSGIQGEVGFSTAVAFKNFGFFGTVTSPGKIVKFDLERMARNGAVTLTTQDTIASAAASSGGSFGYFGTRGIPPKILKFNLETMEQVGALSGHNAEASFTAALVSGEYGYYGAQSVSGKIVKVFLGEPVPTPATTTGPTPTGVPNTTATPSPISPPAPPPPLPPTNILPPPTPARKAAEAAATSGILVVNFLAMAPPVAISHVESVALGYISCAPNTMKDLAETSKWVLFPCEDVQSLVGDASVNVNLYRIGGNLLISVVFLGLHKLASMIAMAKFRKRFFFPSLSFAVPVLLGQGTALASTQLIAQEPQYAYISIIGYVFCCVPLYFMYRIRFMAPQLFLRPSPQAASKAWSTFFGVEMWTPDEYVSKWGYLFSCYKREGVFFLNAAIVINNIVEGITIGASQSNNACDFQLGVLLLTTLFQLLYLCRRRYFIAPAMQVALIVVTFLRALHVLSLYLRYDSAQFLNISRILLTSSSMCYGGVAMLAVYHNRFVLKRYLRAATAEVEVGSSGASDYSYDIQMQETRSMIAPDILRREDDCTTQGTITADKTTQILVEGEEKAGEWESQNASAANKEEKPMLVSTSAQLSPSSSKPVLKSTANNHGERSPSIIHQNDMEAPLLEKEE